MSMRVEKGGEGFDKRAVINVIKFENRSVMAVSMMNPHKNIDN